MEGVASVAFAALPGQHLRLSPISQHRTLHVNSLALRNGAAITFKSGFFGASPLRLKVSRSSRMEQSIPVIKPRRGQPSPSCAVAQDSTGSQREFSLGSEKQLYGLENVVKDWSSSVRTLACAAFIAGSAGLGYTVGSRILPPIGRLALTLALGGAGAVGAHLLNKAGKDAAAKHLFNAIVTLSVSENLKRSDIQALADKYGISLTEERAISELKDVYDRYLTQVLPESNKPLTGSEVDLIIQFKAALGLDDDDAASVHMEVGRRIFRQRMEAGNKDGSVAERKAFQKLVYVSNLVFGEKSKFLLPWKRVFKVNESQVDIAVQDNAKRLLQNAVDESNADADLTKLRALRAAQLKFRVSDEVAEELFREKSRGRVEAHIETALEVLQARSRVKDIPRVLRELESLMAYSSAMGALSSEEGIIPGVGAVTVAGGVFDGERQITDLKQLYRTFLEDALSGDRLEDSKVAALSQLRNIFGMGRKEALSVEVDVTAKVYRRKLGQAVKSGELEAAASKAVFLEDLCDKLRFDPEEAFRIHEEIYRQKLEMCLEDKVLDDEDVKALQRLRVLLCIPQTTVDAAHTEVCGKIFEKVIDDALGSGVDGYDPEMQKTVQEAVKGLRLPVQSALAIAGKIVKSIFLTYIKRSRSGNRTEAGRELKKLVIFSNLTVSQLLDDIRRGSGAAVPEEEKKKEEEAEKKEEEEEEKEEKEKESLYGMDGLEMLQSLRKTKGVVREGKPQKEITLKDDLEERERKDVYERFLMYAIQGETMTMAMGTTVTVQKDNSDFVRLSQLGDILGLSPLEVAMVHQGLAEKAFKTQAQTLLADGQLSKSRAEQLKQIQKSFGLPDAAAQKVIQSITSTKMAGAIDQAVQQGKLTVDDIRGLREAGVDIQTMVASHVRTQLFRKLVTKAFTTGTGEFDTEEIYERLPVDLGLDPEAMKSVVVETAKERLKDALVQAVALLRQKQTEQVVNQLNNLVACDKADPQALPLSWPVKEELLDLYGVYIAQPEFSVEKSNRLRELLDIDERTAATLADMVESGGFSLDTKEEDFVF